MNAINTAAPGGWRRWIPGLGAQRAPGRTSAAAVRLGVGYFLIDEGDDGFEVRSLQGQTAGGPAGRVTVERTSGGAGREVVSTLGAEDGTSTVLASGLSAVAARDMVAGMKRDALRLIGADGGDGDAGGRKRRTWLAPLAWGVAAGLLFVFLANLGSGDGAQQASPVGQGGDGVPTQLPPEFAALPPEAQRELLELTRNAAIAAVRGDPADPAQQPGPAFGAEQLAQIRAASALPSVKLTGTGDGNSVKVVYAFEDPQCPSCRELHQASQGLDRSRYEVRVIPIAGLEGSRDLVARALCDAKPADAWKMLMMGSPLTGPVCAKGLETVDKNSALFHQLGLNRTPSVVAPNGRLVIGAGSTQALQAWIDAQSGPAR